ncbi:acyl-CoA reductase [Rhodohalobacter sp.]|uniref:acyl-CoA reductase n=1 Tax=Rhodohalobacter sp. TaxID=1974210 RepID=UPI002ACDE005|nr:acyl-CoA reductase [Rhodohalobacter sp.]MDZ7757329.1 acyl-CoA reductase [Rhodohalobacter sp.]
MVTETREHIKNISGAIDAWLQPDNLSLKKAIDQTVEENLFGLEDIKHQIRHLKYSLTEDNLLKWAEITNLKISGLKGKNILCLHAGNLPLVGLQDLLATVLTGANYVGKLSRKDPYLLPTLIEKLDDHKISGDRHYSADLNDFSNKEADAVLFAGSEDSVNSVISNLKDLNIVDFETPRLMRTAHFSIAFINDHNKETMEDLAEAVFRYGGTGCRSVAIVIAPFKLKSQKCHLTDYFEIFWLKNPQHEKPDQSLFYRFATNKALGIDQAWLNDFLIEERLSKPTDKFVLQWIQGDEDTLKDIVDKFKDGLQTVYTTSESQMADFKKELETETDLLSKAQTPDIWWKPDGIDTITWLQKELG